MKTIAILLYCFIIALFVLSGCGVTDNGNPDNSTNPPLDTTSLAKPSKPHLDSLKDSCAYISWDTVSKATGYLVHLHGCGDSVTYFTPMNRINLDTIRPGCDFYLYIYAMNSRDTSVQCDSGLNINTVRHGSPDSVRIVQRSQSSLTIQWAKLTHANNILGYRAYLRNHQGTKIDSLDRDTSTFTATFSNLQPEKAYKINVATLSIVGPGTLDSNILYDTTTYTDPLTGDNRSKKMPWLYVSTYSTPIDYTGTYAGVMKGVPGGTFVMGTIWSDSTSAVGAGERPAHDVLLSSYFLAKYEITNAQYVQFLNDQQPSFTRVITNTPFLQDTLRDTSYFFSVNGDTVADTKYSTFGFNYNITDTTFATFTVKTGKDSFPACAGVTWRAAIRFCNWLSQKEGFTPCYDLSTGTCTFSANGYRLPTEAEFEYVAGGAFRGTKTRFPWGYKWESSPVTYDCGTLRAVGNNVESFGFYDIMANVQEWCYDWADAYVNDGTLYYVSCAQQGIITNPTGPSTGNHHVMRSGSYEQAYAMRFWENYMCTYRYPDHCDKYSDYGLRVARNTN